MRAPVPRFDLRKVWVCLARALQFIKARRLANQQATVPKFSSVLTLWCRGDDRTEERRAFKSHNGRTDVLPHEVDTAAVACAQLRIKLIGVVVLHQIRRQAHLFKCLFYDFIMRLTLAPALWVVPRT